MSVTISVDGDVGEELKRLFPKCRVSYCIKHVGVSQEEFEELSSNLWHFEPIELDSVFATWTVTNENFKFPVAAGLVDYDGRVYVVKSPTDFLTRSIVDNVSLMAKENTDE